MHMHTHTNVHNTHTHTQYYLANEATAGTMESVVFCPEERAEKAGTSKVSNSDLLT
jgi:hypothetical protein